MFTPRILLMRHGQVRQQEPRRFLGQQDVVLDATGRQQAELAGQRLQDLDIGLALCSDLIRAEETAKTVLRGREVELMADPRLREICLGQWQGLTQQEVEERFPGEHEARGADLAGFRPTGGESFRDVQLRAKSCLEELPLSQGNVLVVAHSGVNRTLLCHALGLDLAGLFSFGQDYCCLNVLLPETEGGAGWRVDQLNYPLGRETVL